MNRKIVKASFPSCDPETLRFRICLIVGLLCIIAVGFIEGAAMDYDTRKLELIQDEKEREQAELMLRGYVYE